MRHLSILPIPTKRKESAYLKLKTIGLLEAHYCSLRYYIPLEAPSLEKIGA
ncbi:hypothetical protein [Candidatus Erwinia haradaeae]|uniref:hypothetical protein n=1 Tax=Candidatus Erwinia haradaeae TaxID=1922217 RepID=UPI001300494D|nr:hypothetical protein [Candidatus Erwinia haradaeae]